MEFVCKLCHKRCKNAGGLARHVKTQHEKPPVKSKSLWQFLKRASPKKAPIELQPIKKKPKQIRFKAKPRPMPVASNLSSSLDKPEPAKQVPGPPRRPRVRQPDGGLSNYCTPSSLTAPDLDRRSPEFRVAHVRFFRSLKQKKFPMMDKAAY